MATITTDIETEATPRNVLQRIWDGMMSRAERHIAPRRQAILALQAKSDAELAGLGLRREDIPHYVFRDLYYA